MVMRKFVTSIARRKAQRKEKIEAKKNKRKRGSGAKNEDSQELTTQAEQVDDVITSKKAKLDGSTGSTKKSKGSSSSSEKEKRKKSKDIREEIDPYANMDPNLAAELRRDDEEIAELERKLGVKKGSKKKSKLNREYATLECYGDDFGDFLDDLDTMVARVKKAGGRSNDDNDDDNLQYKVLNPDESDSDVEQEKGDEESDEEKVPMKGPAESDLDDDGSDSDSESDEQDPEESADSDESADDNDDIDGEQSGTNSESEEESKGKKEKDEVESASDDESAEEVSSDEGAKEAIDVEDTYRPSEGEDIYGNRIQNSGKQGGLKKYVPPHLRQKVQSEDETKSRAESLREIQRTLNSSLNRLSEDTLVSISQTVAKLYPLHPTSNINESIWTNARSACISPVTLMTGLIPVYVAALVGVHFQKGDSAQLAEFLLEMTVADLWKELFCARQLKKGEEEVGKETKKDGAEDEITLVDKRASNLLLILCYLYNFGVSHCSLMYDVVRDLIKNFTEIDLELLLLILCHSGRALRSDDPSALKEIVLMVQQRVVEEKDASYVPSSRVDYMISAMSDLKNNKRRKIDAVFSDRVAKLKKLLGQVKKLAASASGSSFHRASDSSLRIGLQDILHVETKGRWWKVGASWVGNQYKFTDNGDEMETGDREKSSLAKKEKKDPLLQEDEKLLKLATKYRMNTDTRRSIFCIIMGSLDCDDSFEKLVRAGMLKNRSERESVRVLMECCGNEKAYNKYYSHLANRICEFQPQCKFSFQLAYWDYFKQFEKMKARKAANLAKFLYSLVVTHNILKLNVLKAIDLSSPDELPEISLIFLTIFFSSILEHFDDPADIGDFFTRGIPQGKVKQTDVIGKGDDGMDHADEGEALRGSITIFLVQVMKASPKYKKGSKFRANLKVAVKACDPDKMFVDD